MKAVKNLVVNKEKFMAVYLAFQARSNVDKMSIVSPIYSCSAYVDDPLENINDDNKKIEIKEELIGYSVTKPEKTIMGTLSGKIVQFIDKHIMPKIFDELPDDNKLEGSHSK